MASKNLNQLTTEELIKIKKAIRFFLGISIGSFLVTVLSIINEGISFLLFIPFAFIPFLFSYYSNINKELKSRKSN
jgi:hypothetical protein